MGFKRNRGCIRCRLYSEQLLYVFEDAEPQYIYVTNKNYKNAIEAKEKYGKEIEVINVDR